MRGVISRPCEEFNGRCADFWAEMAALRVLSKDGFTAFKAIHGMMPDGSTCDYEAFSPSGKPVYVEVKNLRSNTTVFDVFHRQMQEEFLKAPSAFTFRLSIDYPYDEPPTAEQERRIKSFVASLGNRQPEFEEFLDLIDATAQIKGLEGPSEAFMVRGMSPDTPEPANKARFLKRVRSKADEARRQICGVREKILVLNYDSSSPMISEDFIEEGKAEIREVFDNFVTPYILFFREKPFVE